MQNLPGNLGVSGAWNLIIKCYVMAPYWIICNDDVSFCPSFLEEMMNTANSDEMIGMIHGNKGDYGVGSWDLFFLLKKVLSDSLVCLMKIYILHIVKMLI